MKELRIISLLSSAKTFLGPIGFQLKSRRILIACVAAAAALLAVTLITNARRPAAPEIPVVTAPVKPSGPSLEEKVALLVDQVERESIGPPKEDYLYTINSGDSLITISRGIKADYGLAETPREIRQGIMVKNNIEDPRMIRAGDKLTIPLSQFVKEPEIRPLDPRFASVFRPYAILDRCNPLSRCWIDEEAIFADEPKKIIYTVQHGDNLYKIAEFIKGKEGLKLPLIYFVQEIAALNDIEDPREVYPDAELEIALANKRTMLGMLSYDGFSPRAGALKLNYTDDEIHAFVTSALKKYTNIPKQTFLRMMKVESGGNHMAISPVGAAGLMQIMPLTGKKLGLRIWNANGYTFPRDIGAPGARAFYRRYARELMELARKNPYKLMKLDDRFNPKKNVFASARLFSRLTAQYGTRNAVAMYNGGRRGLTPNRARETQNYMRLVLR